MQPYFENNAITLYNADCSTVVDVLGKGSVDLIVTDPPYGMDWNSGRREKSERFGVMENDTAEFDLAGLISKVLPALKRGRHVYIFGKPDISNLPLTQSVELIWDKGIIGTGNLSLPWGGQHETITFATYEYSKANREKGYGNLAARLRKGSVLRCQRRQSGQCTLHPTEKPVPLLRQLVESSSVFGETVLDPFAGSGSTLEAAYLEGRKSIGFEIDERYCEVAAKRLDSISVPFPELVV